MTIAASNESDVSALVKKIDPKKNPVVEAKVDQGRSDYGKATIRNWRHSGPSTVDPAMFDPENKRGKTIEKRRAEHKARRGVKGAKVPTYTKEEKIEEGNWVQKKWQQFVPPPSKSANPNVRSGKLQPGKLEAGALKSMNQTAANINKPIKHASTTIKKVKSGVDKVTKAIDKSTKAVGSAAKAAAPIAGGVGVGLAVSKGVDRIMKGGKKKEAKEGYSDWRSDEELMERVGGAGTLVRQGVKYGGKKGGRAVQKGQASALKAGQGAKAKAAQGNQSKMIGTGRAEKIGAVAGGLAGGVALGALDGPVPVGDIVGGIAGSKIGGKIGRQVDKAGSAVKKAVVGEGIVDKVVKHYRDKKKPKKHQYPGRDAGKLAKDRLADKEHNKYVNFLPAEKD